MKRFCLRKSLLLCAPISLIGLVWLIPRLLYPPKDLNAVISLSVREKPSHHGINPRNPRLQFAWETTATGGPQYH